MNQIAMTGRVASDPEGRVTSSGTAVFNFRFCDDLTNDFFSCAAFGQTAERMEKLKIAKGTKLMLFGSFKMDEYTDRNGEKRSALKINVSNFSFGSSKTETAGTNETATRPPIAERSNDFSRLPDLPEEALPFK